MRKLKVVLRNTCDWAVVDENNQVIMESNKGEECERFLDLETLPPLKKPKQDCMFFSSKNDDTARLVGHLRFDFGETGRDSWCQWWQRCDEAPHGKNPDMFKKELNEFIDMMRERVLKGVGSITSFCWRHNISEINGSPLPSRGFVMESEHYEFYVRICISDYSYIYCYEKDTLNEDDEE